jgi:hypothetical protein
MLQLMVIILPEIQYYNRLKARAARVNRRK